MKQNRETGNHIHWLKPVASIALLLFAGGTTYLNCVAKDPKGYIELGTFWVLTLTLIALVWYVSDTYIIAKDSEANSQERKLHKSKQANKHAIWRILDQKSFLAMADLENMTSINSIELSPLIFEMIQEGLIYEDFFKNGYTRYKPESNAGPYS